MRAVNYFFKNPVAVALRDEGREEGREEGRVRERIAGVLRTLDRRHVEAPDSVRERVRGRTDLDLLQVWLDRAHEVTDAADLFEAT